MMPDFLKWGFVDASDPSNKNRLDVLAGQMNSFYNSSAHLNSYWDIAGAANDLWRPDAHKYHLHLKHMIGAGERLADFGCGNAHVYKNLSDRNVDYIGLEWSEKQVEENKKKYPAATFIAGDITNSFFNEELDWAISMFVLEHCVMPHLLLLSMFNAVKRGGKIAIICPDFTYGMNSVRTGFRPTTKKEKLAKGQFADLLVSMYQEKFIIPKRIKKIQESELLFPIYLKPRCLEAKYFSDNDAVFLTNEEKIKKYLVSLGAKIITDSRDFDERRNLIYIVAQKQ